MHALYVFSVWLHILAATAWVGGIMFITLVVVPWLRGSGRAIAGPFLQQTGIRFRNVGWVCFAIVLMTGTFNLWVRGVRLADFASAGWRSSSFGQSVILKLSLFATVLIVSAVHDFVVGPKATAAITADPRGAEAEKLRRHASLLGRLNALLALLLLLTAVMLVRGALW